MIANIMATILVAAFCFGAILYLIGLIFDIDIFVNIGRFCVLGYIIIVLLVLGIVGIWTIWR